jgi:hypothetical protein
MFIQQTKQSSSRCFLPALLLAPIFRDIMQTEDKSMIAKIAVSTNIAAIVLAAVFLAFARHDNLPVEDLLRHHHHTILGAVTPMVVVAIFPFLRRLWNTFFFTEINEKTLKLTGYLRIFLALIFLYDQVLWTLDRQWMMAPSTGLVKYNQRGDEFYGYHTLLSFAPDSDVWMWCIHIGGLICGVFFLMGVAPKLFLLGMYASCVSFQNMTFLPHDMQDSMLRLWCFWFLFMPLHHVTIYDFCRETPSEKQQSSTSPHRIWPYRLCQFQTIFVYTGASWGKLALHDSWTSGIEIWKSLHGHIFCQGPFQPDVLFNRLMPLKLLAWSAIFIETISIILVWPATTRSLTVWTMIIFHLGIDWTMNMVSQFHHRHCDLQILGRIKCCIHPCFV